MNCIHRTGCVNSDNCEKAGHCTSYRPPKDDARVGRQPTIAEQQGCDHIRWFVSGENAEILLCDQCGATRPRVSPSNVARPDDRETFEERAFFDYFIKGVHRNPNPPKGTGALDFIPDAEGLDKATFCERDGEGYKRDDVGAMWHGWKLARKHGSAPVVARPIEIEDIIAQEMYEEKLMRRFPMEGPAVFLKEIRRLQALIPARAPKMARPDTHRLVPRVPTETMVDALDDALADCHDSRQALILAIDAAPAP